jgi:lysozyme
LEPLVFQNGRVWKASELTAETCKQTQKKNYMKTLKANVMIITSAIALVAGSASATRPLGIDVSHYQGSPTWSSVYSDGVRFAFAKATEGNYYHDSSYTYNMSHAKSAGVVIGAYDFARPDQIGANTEADYFWSFAGGYITTDGKSLYPMVDFEVFGGHVGYTSYTSWFNAWSSRVKSKKTTFMHPVIYASAGNGMCDLSTSCTLSAWVANYNGQNLYTGNPWSCCSCCNYVNPCTSSGWTYWQVSSTGAISGISGNVDLDTYPLTLSELKSYQIVGAL